MKISDNKFVSITYDLTVGEGEEQELMERATAEQPLEFIFGTNSMLKSFENNLFGLSKDDKFKFTLTPEEAYGEFYEERVIDLPKNIFEVDGKIDEEMLFEGNTLPMMDADGNRLTGSIVSIAEDTVTMDFNHPLAGETLQFEGEVIEVREPTNKEIAALMHEHEGCGGGCQGCHGC